MTGAIIAGYIIGSIPTAALIARARGVDLLRHGSRTANTSNAFRVGGRRVGLLIIGTDVVLGAAAGVAGQILSGDAGAAAAASTALLGHIASPWLRFTGGRGIAVACGASLVVFPLGALAAIAVSAIFYQLLRLSRSVVVGLLVFGVAAVVWASAEWPNLWGISTDDTLVWYAIAVLAITGPKVFAWSLPSRG